MCFVLFTGLQTQQKPKCYLPQPQLEKEKGQTTSDHTIRSKTIKARPLNQPNHPLASDDTADKCGSGTREIGQKQLSGEACFDCRGFSQILNFQNGRAQNHRQGHEKAEPRSFFPRNPQRNGSADGRT